MVNNGLEVGVLGPLRVVVRGESVEVTRGRVRAALCALAARTNLPTSGDFLIDHLWPQELPADPKAALAVVLSRVRSTLGQERDALSSGPQGYRLDAKTDIADFDDAVGLARRTEDIDERITQLRYALHLWRGDPFQGDPGSKLSAADARLTEARWSATTLLAGALLQRNRYQEIIEVSLPLALDQPHREQLIMHCAQALGMAGRKSDAISLISRCRSFLRDEMGLDAGPALDDLELALLQGSLDLRPSEAVSVDEQPSSFVGRKPLLKGLVLGQGSTALVGEAGMGKSALLTQLGAHWGAEGQAAVSVRASSQAARPIQTIADLVGQLSRGRDKASTDPQAQLALNRIAPDDFDPPDDQRSLSRDALVEDVAAWICAVCEQHEIAIVIDDAHWMDATSTQVVRRLARESTRIIVASRPGPPPVVDELLNSLDEFVTLEPLTTDDVEAALAARLPSAAQTTRAGDLWNRTGGNALFMTLLLDVLVEGEDIDSSLPTSVLLAVRRRIEVLSSRALHTLQIAAMVGESVELPLLRMMVATADADIAEASAANLVLVDSGEDDVDFIHSLVWEGLVEMVPAGTRIEFHDEIGTTLELLGASATRFAAHYGAAAALDPVRAAHAHHQAAVDFAAAYDWGQTFEHAQAAAAFAGSEDGLLRARLDVLMGQSQRDLHQGGDSMALRRAAEIAREHGDERLQVDAVVALCVQGWSMDADESKQPLDLLEQALELDLATTDRAVLCASGATLMQSEHHVRGRSLYREALALVADTPDPAVQAQVYELAHWGLSHPEDHALLLQTSDRLSDLSGTHRHLRWQAATTRFSVGVISVNPQAVDEAIDTMRTISADLSPSPKDWEMAHTEATYATVRGDYGAAHDHLERVYELGLQTTSRGWVLPIYGSCLIALLRSQGRTDGALGLIDEAIQSNPSYTGWRAAAASAASVSGDLDRARAELTMAMPLGSDLSGLRPAIWTGETALLGDAITALGDVERARVLFDVLSPFAGRMSWTGVSSLGPVDATLASLCAVLGEHDLAAGFVTASDSMTAAFRSP